ncbi:MAG: hypothetical protein ACREV7_18835 [Steroidobacteraceae bacterium]
MEVDSGNDGPVFLAPHAQRQLAISIPEHGRRQLDLDVIGLGRVPVTAASRHLIFDGELDPAFLRQIQLTIDLEQGRAWARFNSRSGRHQGRQVREPGRAKAARADVGFRRATL